MNKSFTKLTACCTVFMFFSLAACSTETKPNMLSAWQKAQWPQVTDEIFHSKDGSTLTSRRETRLYGDNKLVTVIKDSNVPGQRVCTMLLSGFEDLLRHECDLNGQKSHSINTLDNNGRIISAVYAYPEREDSADSGHYEYFGGNTVFRAYRKEVLVMTGLVEKLPGWQKYTVWQNLPEMAVHVEEYDENGTGHETYISARSPFPETSETVVFLSDGEKIVLTLEKSQDYPQGMLTIKHSYADERQEIRHNIMYQIIEPQILLPEVADFHAAKQLIARAKVFRESKSYSLRI